MIEKETVINREGNCNFLWPEKDQRIKKDWRRKLCHPKMLAYLMLVNKYCFKNSNIDVEGGFGFSHGNLFLSVSNGFWEIYMVINLIK